MNIHNTLKLIQFLEKHRNAGTKFDISRWYALPEDKETNDFCETPACIMGLVALDPVMSEELHIVPVYDWIDDVKIPSSVRVRGIIGHTSEDVNDRVSEYLGVPSSVGRLFIANCISSEAADFYNSHLSANDPELATVEIRRDITLSQVILVLYSMLNDAISRGAVDWSN